MRILHLTSGNMFGGLETCLLTLARHAAAAAGTTQEFGLCFEGRLSRELRELGAKVRPLGGVRIGNPLRVRRVRGVLRSLLRDERPDLVVIHSPWAMVLFGGTVRRARIPLVFWLHDRADGRHWLQRLARRIRPDLVLCNSEYTESTLGLLYPTVPSRVVYYPVDPPPADGGARGEVRTALGAAPEDAVIIQVSRMEAWKGHALHLRALAELRDLPGWVCWQVGGAQRPEEEGHLAAMQRLADDLGIADRVRFLGQRSDVGRLLAAADVHCQPNAGPEPFGIVFIEAMYAGLPTIATSLGGPREIVTADCGILVPPEDPPRLAEALRSMIRDPERRRRMGAAGRDRAGRLCAPDAQVARIGDLLVTLARPEAVA